MKIPFQMNGGKKNIYSEKDIVELSKQSTRSLVNYIQNMMSQNKVNDPQKVQYIKASNTKTYYTKINKQKPKHSKK